MKLFDPVLMTSVSTVDDLEHLRIALDNRLRQLTRDEPDEDGEERGFALPEDHVAVANLREVVDGVKVAEKSAIKLVEKLMKAHPLGAWVLAQHGIGLKMAARMLGAIGDPYWNDLHDRPRLVSELWSYCGYAVRDGEAPKHRKGQQANWSDEARMRVWLIAQKVVMLGKETNTPMYQLYTQTKKHYAEAVHDRPCVRCGPAGKPAQPGSPISDGHRHARAIRKVAKEILKDLWKEARRIYQEDGS